jgi:hypothetical protein
MTVYYDGPRKGIADVDGRPHFYESEWDDWSYPEIPDRLLM